MSKIITIDFTKSFMDEMTGYIEKEYLLSNKPLNRLCIVFGGKRPFHFLRRSLANKIKKTFIPPVCLTMDELIDNITGSSSQQEGLDFHHSYILYDLIRREAKDLLKDRESFASFLPWTQDLIHLISQLDLEDISKEQLTYIQESSRIGFPVPETMNRLLERIALLRNHFHDTLKAKGQKTRAMGYVQASEMIQNWEKPYDEIIFANFFYFYRTEEKIIKELLKQGKTTLMFQGDERKWPILKRISKTFDCSLQEGKTPTPIHFDLQVHSAFDEQTQAVVVRHILEAIPDHSKTAIILPDPQGIVSLLSALPEDLKDVNVSMGYPLKRSSLYQLVNFILMAQKTVKDGQYYTPDYLNVLQHPFVKTLALHSDARITRVIVHKIEEMLKGLLPFGMGGVLFVDLEQIAQEHGLLQSITATLSTMEIVTSPQEIQKTLRQLHQILFLDFETIHHLKGFSQKLQDLLDTFSLGSLLQKDFLNQNILTRMKEILDEFKQVDFKDEKFYFDEMSHLLETAISNANLYFSGTPLKGLQILGLFETRSLNFDHVIVLDVNEGILPLMKTQSSMIPQEVLNGLTLGRLELEEEIQRYQLMRLISSAKSVYLIYQKNKEKESSRFLEELIWEQQKKDQQEKKQPLTAYPMTVSGFPVYEKSSSRSIVKTPQIIESLKNMTYSASAIDTYLNNPYRFYTDYVLRLRETEDALEEPDHALVGIFVHSLLEDLYRPWVNHNIIYDQKFEREMLNLFEKKFHDFFEKKMRADSFLMRKIIKHQMTLFFQAEQKRNQQIEKLLAVEEKFQFSLTFSCGKIHWKGYIDRIDQIKDNQIVVIDYKTGSVAKLPKKNFIFNMPPPEERDPLFLREYLYENVRSFQLPLYLFAIQEQHPHFSVDAGLYLLQKMELKLLFHETKVSRQEKISQEQQMDEWKKALESLFQEILNPDIPFVDYELEEEW